MMGSKRLTALENELAALRTAVERQTVQAEAADAAAGALQGRLDEANARLDASAETFAQMAARLDAIEASLVRHADIGQNVERLSDMAGAEQARRAALEQTIAKLEKRIDEQGEEARITAAALLQRLESALRSRSGTGQDQASAR